MNIRERLIRQAKSKAVQGAKDNIPDEAKKAAAKVSELANDAKDVAKIAANASAGNWVGVATTALKNRKIRRILIALLITALIVPMISLMLMMTLIIGASDLFQHPMMGFGSNQTITETEPNGQTATINFLTLANEWTKTIRWGAFDENKGLTSAEISQVNQLQLGLSYGLLETFYEIGVRAGAKNPLKSLDRVVQLLQPSEIDFKPVQLRKVGYSNGKKYYYYVTEMVLQNITRYNGYWVTNWKIVTESDGSQIVVFGPSTLQQKNYQPLYNAEAAFNFLHNTLDQQILFGQALVLDSNFFDPSALPILQILEGGTMGGNGGPPSQGEPMPEPQIIAILQQAVQIDQVPESWLPGLEIIVEHEDASGNPYAVNPTPVDGEHASGLMQMLPSTFWSDHVNGYNNIWNPLDNAVAAIRHIEGAWESPYNIPGVVSGVYKGY